MTTEIMENKPNFTYRIRALQTPITSPLTPPYKTNTIDLYQQLSSTELIKCTP